MARLSRDFPPGPLAATATTATARQRLPTLERLGVRRASLAIAVTLAVAIAHLAADDTASARAEAADPELARLLRVMAFAKAAMAAQRRRCGWWTGSCAASGLRPCCLPGRDCSAHGRGTGAHVARRACRHGRPVVPRRGRPVARAGLAPYPGLAVGAKPRAVTLTMADAGARRRPQFGTAGRDRRPKRATPCGSGTASLSRHVP